MTTDIKKLLTATAKSAKITRLVAEENITVEYSDTAETASFSPATRTITYPYSMILEDDDIHMLFIFHEVAHALFSTNQELFEQACEMRINSYFNVTEDIRIERLIKHKYPGVVGNFHKGYEKLLDKGFFGDMLEIPFMNFANRLNVYAKLGPITGRFIQFSQEEIEFYNRCVNAETEEEAFTLAKELFEITEGGDTYGRLMSMLDDDVSGSITVKLDELIDKFFTIDEDDTDDEEDDVVSLDDGERSGGSYGNLDELDDEAKEQQLKKLAEYIDKRDTVAIFESSFKETTITNCAIHPFKSYTKDQLNYVRWQDFVADLSHLNADMTHTTKKFRDSCKIAIDSMVREFEAKKAAYRQKYAKITNTGRIDVNRIVNYKFDDMIFAKQIDIADAKNHGFVILLDCSGSIDRQYSAMAEQVIILTEFFRKIGVKYRVFGYGATFKSRLYDKRIQTQTHYANLHDKMGFLSYEAGASAVLEFLNSEMTLHEHAMACHGMARRINFSLGSTPSIDALLQMEVLANEFFLAHNVQKKKLINITDGAPTDMSGDFYYNDRRGSANNARATVVVDSITKKNYMIRRCAFSAAHAIACVYRDRYGIETINIGLGASTMLPSFIGRSANEAERKQRAKLNYMEITTEYKSKVFIAPGVRVKNNIVMSNVNSDSTIGEATKEFKSILKRNVKSKNFLNILAKTLSE